MLLNTIDTSVPTERPIVQQSRKSYKQFTHSEFTNQSINLPLTPGRIT